jgi:hypothetical protein
MALCHPRSWPLIRLAKADYGLIVLLVPVTRLGFKLKVRSGNYQPSLRSTQQFGREPSDTF